MSDDFTDHPPLPADERGANVWRAHDGRTDHRRTDDGPSGDDPARADHPTAGPAHADADRHDALTPGASPRLRPSCNEDVRNAYRRRASEA